MSKNRPLELGWIIAIAALLVLLAVGLCLYMGMSAPLRADRARKTRSSSIPSAATSAYCARTMLFHPHRGV